MEPEKGHLKLTYREAEVIDAILNHKPVPSKNDALGERQNDNERYDPKETPMTEEQFRKTDADHKPTPVEYPAITGTQLTRLDDVFHIEVKIERNIGDVKLTYGLSANYIAVNSSQLAQAYDEVRSLVESQHELAMKNRPALMPSQLKDHVSQNVSTILCTHVRKEYVAKIGERIRLLGGEFSTHGIACYPEFFEALGIVPDELPNGDTSFNKYVLVQMNGRGVPVRALSIVPGP